MASERGEEPDWILLAMAIDEQTAEAWREMLEKAGIESDVRYDERSLSLEAPSTIPQLQSAGSSMWSYPVCVHQRDRRAARTVLERSREEMEAAAEVFTVKGTLIVVGGVLIAVVVLVLLKG